MDRISYDYYRVFYYVAKYGSLSRAAEILHGSQPNITKFMNNLESQLGCRLLLRSNKGVALTPEGAKLYEHVQIAYAQLREAENELTGFGHLSTGTIRIGTTETAMYGVLLNVLAKFRKAYPGIRLYITNDSTAGTSASLQKGMLDLAVVTSPTDSPPKVKDTPLLPFEEILVAAAGSALSEKKSMTPAEVAACPIVGLGHHTKTYAFYTRLFLPFGVEWQPDIDLATSDQILPMVKAGLGIGFVPEFMARKDLAEGTVAPIEVVGLKPKRQIVLLEDPSKSLSAAAAKLKEMMWAAKAGRTEAEKQDP